MNSRDGQGKAPLHHAAERDSGATIQVLLDAKADVDANADDEKTPLHTAAAHGNIAAAKVLLAAGADIDARRRFYRGATSLELAITGGHQGLMQLLLDANASVEGQGS